jgi:hypothetical protein
MSGAADPPEPVTDHAHVRVAIDLDQRSPSVEYGMLIAFIRSGRFSVIRPCVRVSRERSAISFLLSAARV